MVFLTKNIIRVMVKKNLQPMKENQLFLDKATALYHFYRDRYGFGDVYQSVKIKQFDRKFEFMNIRLNDDEYYSIGLLHQRFLTTVIFCDRPNAFKDSKDACIVYTVYGGKLAPKGQADHYCSTFKLIHSPQKPGSAIQLKAFDIIQNLGQFAVKAHLSPININKVGMLQIFFDKDGRICDLV